MTSRLRALVLRSAVAGLVAVACQTAGHPGAPASVRPQGAPGMTPAQLAESNGGVPPVTEADVQFMSGMIGHHAQAIAMAGWAQSHGASGPVRTLCERMIISQMDEIKYMQGWLTDRHQRVPVTDPRGLTMPGMDHPMPMPGMLTADAMAQLDQMRGREFDRTFLTDMIAHHRGALEMVHRLLTSPGAGQDAALFAYATDVQAGQAAEIGRMQRMLSEIPSGEARADPGR